MAEEEKAVSYLYHKVKKRRILGRGGLNYAYVGLIFFLKYEYSQTFGPIISGVREALILCTLWKVFFICLREKCTTIIR